MISARAFRVLVTAPLIALAAAQTGAVQPEKAAAGTTHRRRVSASRPQGPTEILVKFKSAADAGDAVQAQAAFAGRRPRLQGALQRAKARALDRPFRRTGFRRLDRIVRYRLEGEGNDAAGRVRHLLAELRQNEDVDYAEPNVLFQAFAAPNDPYYSSSGSWGQSVGDLWGLHTIGAETAWSTTQGLGVTVAVLDTGLSFNHPDLAANVWLNPGENGLDGFGQDKRTNNLDDDANGYVDDWRGYDFMGFSAWSPWPDNDPSDVHGHGTHVAGTIAAVGNNGQGIVGVAHRAKVMAVRVLDDGGWGSLDGIAGGVIYAADAGARVLNMSLGGSPDEPMPQTLKDAIDYAHDVKGAVVVVAAGNSSWDVGTEQRGVFPAAFRDVITVAATGHDDVPASFSNYGAALDIAAPGGGGTDPGVAFDPHRSILSLLSSPVSSSMTGSGQLIVGGNLVRQAGTSMAAPHVAGVAALLLSANPGWTSEQVRQALRVGATDIGTPGFDTATGYGRLHAAGALAQTQPLAARLFGPVGSLTAADTASVRGSVGGSGLVQWNLSYGQGPSPTAWVPLASGSTSITNGELTSWPLASVPDGEIQLRLVAQNTVGVTFEDRMPFRVDSLVITGPAAEMTTPYRGGASVPITGSVVPYGFQSYSVGIYGVRTGWLTNANVTLANGGTSPVQQGLLATWNTTGAPADHYQVCVYVTTSAGQASDCVALLVDPQWHAGPPINLGKPINWNPMQHLTAADINGDGAKELLIAYGYQMRVLRPDGTSLSGWPVTVGNSLVNGPVVGDVTGDSGLEILTGDDAGYVHMWKTDGTPVSGWPRRLLTTRVSLALFDLDADGRLDIVAAPGWSASTSVTGTVVVVRGDGSALPGWPQAPATRHYKAPAFGDVDGDGAADIVLSTLATPTVVYAMRANGTLLPGWPVTLDPGEPASYVPGAQPVVADLDGDGDAEVVIATRRGTAMVLRGDGTIAPGWPQTPAGNIDFNTAAVGDVDGDGSPEIVSGGEDSSGRSVLHVWRPNGTSLPNWPKVSSFFGSSYFGYGPPTLADLDGDGKADIVVASNTTYDSPFALHAFRWDGTTVAGFPKPTLDLAASADNAAAVADLDGDGLLELAWIDWLANVYIWDVNAPASGPAPWPMYRRDVRHTGSVPSAANDLRVVVEGTTGRGTVSLDTGASCDNLDGAATRTCTYPLAPGTAVTLTATPRAGDMFLGWSGACTGTAATCAVVVEGLRSVTARFNAMDLPPTANPGGPYTVNRGQAVAFDGSGSSDPEGQPLTYTWDFGDGGTGTGVSPVRTYAAAGIYAVTLTVSDGVHSHSAGTSVTVVDPPPAAVTNLRIRSVDNRSVTLEWTATGADGMTGTASMYDLRFSTQPIDEGNFASATRSADIMLPRAPGTLDSARIATLLATSDYYFALKVIDAGGNASALSNVVTGKPTGVVLFYDDFETSLSEWTLTGDPQSWERSTALARTPSHSLRRRTLAAGDNSGHATIGPLRLQGAVKAYMSFQLASPGCNSANVNVQASTDGGHTFVSRWTLNVGGNNGFTSRDWDMLYYNPEYAEKTMYFRFVFSGCSTTGNSGWYLDDVLISANSLQPISKPGGPYSGLKNQPVQFDGSASIHPVEGGTLTYAWNFGDGTTGTGAQPTHTYATAGTYTVSLVVSDGTTSVYGSTTAAITSQPPVSVPGGPYAGTEGGTVSFDGRGSSDPDGDPLTYSWNFGDGTTGTGPTPTHLYGTSGALTASLTVSDGNTSATATTPVTIAPVPPAAITNLAGTTLGGRSVRLDWTATGDDGAVGTATSYDLRYSTAPIDAGNWAAATAAVGEPTPKASGLGETMNVTGLAAGTTYYFALVAVDNAGNASPISNVATASTLTETLVFRDDMESGLSKWTITGVSNGSGGASLWHVGTHRYSSPTRALYYGRDDTRTYNTGARNYGAATSRSIRLVGATYATLHFRHLLAKESSTAYDVARVMVSTNDGVSWTTLASYASTGSMVAASVDLTPYVNATIRLRFDFDTVDSAINDLEGWVVDDVEVVSNRTNDAPVADVGGPYSGDTNAAITFDGSASSDPDGDALTYSWDFGDGATAATASATHTYAANGTYSVTLVVDDGAQSATATTTVAVGSGANQSPVADAGPDQTLQPDEPAVVDGSASQDPDGDPLSYEWRDEANAVVATTATANVTAPVGPSTFLLTVADGNGGSGTDTVVLTRLPRLTVVVQGAPSPNGLISGSGVVSGADVSCDNTSSGSNPVTCTSVRAVGEALTLVATPAADSVFMAWEGACAGTTPTCTVTFDDHRDVIATFRGPQPVMVDIENGTNGSGAVTIDPSGTICAAPEPGVNRSCPQMFRIGTTVTLTHTAGPDSAFIGWTGACEGLAPTCTFTVSGDQPTGATAHFQGPRGVAVDVLTIEGGSGALHLSPPDVDCIAAQGSTHASCPQMYRIGTTVTVTYTAGSDSVFAGWMGACSGMEPTCTFTVTDDPWSTLSVGAQFRGPQPVAIDVISVENGSGGVTIDPPGTSCVVQPGAHESCMQLYRIGTTVTLTYVEGPDSVFAGWIGACNDMAPTCTFTVTGEEPYGIGVAAQFRGPQPVMVDVFTMENGSGGVTIDPPGVTCVADPGSYQSCPQMYRIGTTVTLTYTEGPDSVFVGWVGACNDMAPTCTFTVTGEEPYGIGVAAQFRGPQPVMVDVFTMENGSGGVTIDPPGATCVAEPGTYQSCPQMYRIGTTVTLSYTEGPDSVFMGWMGACDGTAPTCTFTVTGDQPWGIGVAAEFRGPQTLTVYVDSSEQGSGSVRIDPPGIECVGAPGESRTCTHSYRVGTTVTLTRLEGPDSILEMWGGPCEGTGPTCTFTITEPMGAAAMFRGPQAVTVQVDSVESGLGSVRMGSTGFECTGARDESRVCTQHYAIGSELVLTAVEAPDSEFLGWMGACEGASATCTVTIPPSGVVIQAAAFRGPRTLSLTVVSTENGDGAVHMNPPSRLCVREIGGSRQCTESYRLGMTVTLSAAEALDTAFVGWAGACTGTSPECTLTMDGNLSVEATYRGPQELTLQVSGVDGAGGTVVVDAPFQGDCVATRAQPNVVCIYPQKPGTPVTLTPYAASDSLFVGWTGACSGIGPCQVVMSDEAVVGATFGIRNQAPVANAGGPYSGVRNIAVALDGSGSTDGDGNALTYTWDFGDGSTGTGVSPAHVYTTLGMFTATLVVHDGTASSAPASTVVTITNVAPTVSVTAPAAASVFTAPADIVLEAGAADVDGGIAKVEFFAGATKLGEDTAAPFTLSWSGVAAGAYALTARATDDDGASVTSTAIPIVVNQPPTAAITSPSSGAAFAGPATIDISATAADADGAIARVEFFQGTTLLGTDTSAPYGFAWTNVAGGLYVLTVRAVDDRGAATVSAPVTVTVSASLLPTADSYVRNGGSANTNFGASATLVVRRANSNGNTRWTYIKFDTSAMASVTSAKLRLFGAMSATTSTAVRAQVFSSANTTWSESSINWNNRPSVGSAVLASVPLVVNSTNGRWYEIDVTAYVQQQRAAGQSTITLVVQNDVNTTAEARFQSKEAASNRPVLLLTP